MAESANQLHELHEASDSPSNTTRLVSQPAERIIASAVDRLDMYGLAADPIGAVDKIIAERKKAWADDPARLTEFMQKADVLRDSLISGPLRHAPPGEVHAAFMRFYRNSLETSTDETSERVVLSPLDREALVAMGRDVLQSMAERLRETIGYTNGTAAESAYKEILSWQNPLNFFELQNPADVRNIVISAIARAKNIFAAALQDAKEDSLAYKKLEAILKNPPATLEAISEEFTKISQLAYGQRYIERIGEIRKPWLDEETHDLCLQEAQKVLAEAQKRIERGEDTGPLLTRFHHQSMASEAIQKWVMTVDDPSLTPTEVTQLIHDTHYFFAEVDALLDTIDITPTTHPAIFNELYSWYNPINKPENAQSSMLTSMAHAALRRMVGMTKLTRSAPDIDQAIGIMQNIVDSYTTPPHSFKKAHSILADAISKMELFQQEREALAFKKENAQGWVDGIIEARALGLPPHLQENLADIGHYVVTTAESTTDHTVAFNLFRAFHRAALHMEATGEPLTYDTLVLLAEKSDFSPEAFSLAQGQAEDTCNALQGRINDAPILTSDKLRLHNEVEDWRRHLYSEAVATPQAQADMAIVMQRRIEKELSQTPHISPSDDSWLQDAIALN